MSRTVYILIPVYNESANISTLYKEIAKIPLSITKFIVFSDDGSKDDTINVIVDQFKNSPHTILSDGLNRGPGSAFNIGFDWIIANSSNPDDLVVTMEADSTSDITLFDKMVSLHDLGFDLVLASVYAQGGGFDGTTFFRKFLSAIANLTFRFLLDIKVLTLSSFYRLYTVTLLKNIKNKNGVIIEENGFICMIEVLVKAIHQNARIIELPMTLNSKKRVGKSKMKIFKTGIEYLKFFMKAKKYKN